MLAGREGEGIDVLEWVRGVGARCRLAVNTRGGRDGVALRVIYLAGVLIGILQVSGARLVKF